MAQAAKIDPMHQFTVEPLVPLHIGSYDISFTNSALWMVLTLLVIFGFMAMLLLLLFLNREFYVFLAAKRGWRFALAAFPFHLLYHFYNGLSFVIGLCRWAWATAWFGKQSGEPVISNVHASDRGSRHNPARRLIAYLGLRD